MVEASSSAGARPVPPIPAYTGAAVTTFVQSVRPRPALPGHRRRCRATRIIRPISQLAPVTSSNPEVHPIERLRECPCSIDHRWPRTSLLRFTCRSSSPHCPCHTLVSSSQRGRRIQASNCHGDSSTRNPSGAVRRLTRCAVVLIHRVMVNAHHAGRHRVPPVPGHEQPL